MNANLTLSEILTISVIILIVFGPHRLPELARKAGVAVAKLRQAAGSVRQELEASTGEFTKPLADIDKELRAAKADLKAAVPDLKQIVPDVDGKTTIPAPVEPAGRPDSEAAQADAPAGAAATSEPDQDEAPPAA